MSSRVAISPLSLGWEYDPSGVTLGLMSHCSLSVFLVFRSGRVAFSSLSSSPAFRGLAILWRLAILGEFRAGFTGKRLFHTL